MANYRAQYEPVARAEAAAAGIDPDIFVRQIMQESGFNPAARSGAGAQGIAQIMPATARGWHVNPADPHAALRAAAQHDAIALKQYGGDWKLALAAYNAGGGNARQWQKIPETRNYVNTILAGHNPAAALVPDAPGAAPAPSDDAAALKLIFGNMPAMQGLFDDETAAAPEQASVPVGADEPTVSGVGTYGNKQVAAWIAPILEYAHAHGWKGQVTSGYRSAADQARIYNSGVRPAAKPGTSNHEFTAYPGGAVDTSDPEILARILAHSPYADQLVYAGAKDPVHFSHPHNGSY